MNNRFEAYQNFYVKKKRLLFPLIGKYTGNPVTSSNTHDQVIKQYFDLLKNNRGFVAELDEVMANANFKNADDGETTAKAPSGQVFSGIMSLIGGGLNAYTTQQQSQLESDKFFYESVLTAQKKDDTKKLLIISGISLAFVGIAVWLVIKYKK